jgi:Zn-dependent protease
MFAELNIVQKVAIVSIPLLFAVTLHEAAHGFVAHKLGDDTAYKLGRITANPFKHIDLVGTIIVPLLFVILPTNFVFGWAKPVPVDVSRLKNPRRDMGLVAAAGPVSNFLMAIAWAGLFKLSQFLLGAEMPGGIALYYMALSGVLVNLVLMVLNLLPIPPLDGSQIMASLLKPKLAFHFQKMGRFGFFIIIGLAVFNLLPFLLLPPFEFFHDLIFTLWGLN